LVAVIAVEETADAQTTSSELFDGVKFGDVVKLAVPIPVEDCPLSRAVRTRAMTSQLTASGRR
jgi:hypothetical protein